MKAEQQFHLLIQKGAERSTTFEISLQLFNLGAFLRGREGGGAGCPLSSDQSRFNTNLTVQITTPLHKNTKAQHMFLEAALEI